MRRLTARERVLLTGLGLAVFGAANLFGLRALLGERAALVRQVDQLRLEQRADAGLLQDQSLWQQRGEWLDKKQPRFQEPGKENASFLEYLQSSLRSKGLAIADQRLNDSVAGPGGQGASVDLEIHGSLQSFIEWLAVLQNPENFRTVPRLTLKSDSEPPKVVCSLTVVQWYSPRP